MEDHVAEVLRKERGPVLAYGLALAAVAAGIALRRLLDPVLGDTLPFVAQFGAVAAAAWVGGYRPAITAALLGYVACSYFFIPPRGQVLPQHLDQVVGLVAYLFTCAVIIAFGEAMRTARQRASERGELLRVTLGSIGDAVITTDSHGRVTYLNSVAEALTGWRQAEALGQPLDAVFRILNEDTRQLVENPATRALRDGAVFALANHTVLIDKDGGEHPIDDSAAPIRDELGRVSGCVLIFRDVATARRAQREKAEQLQAARLLASIVESSDDAIIRKSLEGVIQSWNAAAERLFGYTAGEAVGRHISLVIPPERIAEEDRIIASLKAGQRIEHFETERVRSDGRRVLVSLTVSPIKDDAGGIVGASKIVRDVTRQHQIEAERQRMEDSLRRLAADLSETDRRKNEFLAMLAHELRSPLAPISNAVEILRLAGSDTTAVRSASEMLQRQVGQMARLVDDLLDMSRVTRGQIELRKERVELAPILRQAVESAGALYRHMNHELTVSLPREPTYLNADPARLAQVVGNLLNNACKFTDKGGRVWLSADEEGAQAVIRVRDSGIGVAAQHLPRLFDMFTQVDTSLERSRDGLGIGLTLVKTLVEMHGGTVEARSEGPGRGSEFVVRLPILGEAPEPRVAASVDAKPTRRRRILIVDDNEDGAESLAMMLRLQGHETRTASDGPEGLTTAERFRPEAILLDIGLPTLNGYEVCRRIREQPWGKDVMLVAVTGWGQEEDRDQSKTAGFDAHVVKPVDRQVIGKLLAGLASRGAASP
jgi:PAS domain S-box-containing protein